MKYKVGDKVRIHNCEGDLWYNGKIGIVIETGRMERRLSAYWDYLCAFSGYRDYPFGSKEMEKISEKGKQLEFAFMNEVVQ